MPIFSITELMQMKKHGEQTDKHTVALHESLTALRAANQDASIAFIHTIFGDVVQRATNIKKVAGGLLPNLFKITEAINAHYAATAAADLNQIHIKDANSYFAAVTLLSLFKDLQRVKTDDAIATKQRELETKIGAYQASGNYEAIPSISDTENLAQSKALLAHIGVLQTIEPDNQAFKAAYQGLAQKIAAASCDLHEPSEPLTTVTLVNAYLASEFDRISALPDRNTQQILLKKLHVKIQHFKNDESDTLSWRESFLNTWHHFFHPVDDSFDDDRFDELSEQVNNALVTETKRVIDDFDALTRTFREKVDNLSTRKDGDEAVTTANTLLADLETLKVEFQKTQDLRTFQAQIKTTVDTFEGTDVFKNNRRSEWWGPIGVFINLLRLILGERTTDTMQKFEAYRDGLEHLGDDENHAPTP
jgi:hypothetical protein